MVMLSNEYEPTALEVSDDAVILKRSKDLSLIQEGPVKENL